jgi:hypothetical protein
VNAVTAIAATSASKIQRCSSSSSIAFGWRIGTQVCSSMLANRLADRRGEPGGDGERAPVGGRRRRCRRCSRPSPRARSSPATPARRAVASAPGGERPLEAHRREIAAKPRWSAGMRTMRRGVRSRVLAQSEEPVGLAKPPWQTRTAPGAQHHGLGAGMSPDLEI